MPTMSVRVVPLTRPKYHLQRAISDCCIASKFLEEFPQAVFLGVAWNPYSTPMMSVRVVPPTRPQYRLKRSLTFDLTVAWRSNFIGVSVGYFPWSSVDSLLHADDVLSSRTTDTTKVPAEKVHNFCSDRWIASKVLKEFQSAVFLGVAWNHYTTPTLSDLVIPLTRPKYRLKRSITFYSTVGSRLIF